MSDILVASNPAYWPSVGGSESVLKRILEGVRSDFDRTVVFAPLSPPNRVEILNGIEIHPYTRRALRRFVARNPPRVFFPNMAHSLITHENLAFVHRFARRIVVNMIGGYPSSDQGFRHEVLKRIEKYADAAVHVDRNSTEYMIDRAVNPNVNYKIISQGIDQSELNEVRRRSDVSRNRPFFLYAHNLWHWKNPDVFVRDLVAKAPNLNFVIAASDTVGDSIDETLELVKAHPNVTVRLGLPRTEFLECIAHSSGIISTSSIEGAQPNIMLESGYLGVPYLSVFPGQNFGHYPHVEMYDSIADLRARILLAGYELREMKVEDLNRARRYFEHDKFDWRNVINEFRSLFAGDSIF